MTSRKSLWRGAALFAGTSTLLVTAMSSAFSAPGAPGVPGGGGGNKPPTETSNNLSVPTVFVPDTTGAPALKFACGASVAPAGETTYFTALDATDNLPDGRAEGYYYLQGEDTWQAGCATAASGAVSATGTWGSNLLGDAALKVGSPVRVEMLLTAAPPTGMDTTGYSVVKLTDQLDRDATYGTLGVAETFTSVGVWASDSKLTIDGPGTTGDVVLAPMGGEVNATGKVVYGYNWRPSVAGTYTATFEAPSVLATASTIAFEVAGSAGRGGGRGGGGPKPR